MTTKNNKMRKGEEKLNENSVARVNSERGNEITALASGDFVYEGLTSTDADLSTREASIASSIFASSTLDRPVDNLKPAEGIEPSESELTIPHLHQAAGYLSEYHTSAINMNAT
jgi:hypothetical protein